MKKLVKVRKRRAFWSLNEDILKITILKTNTPYPSRKIRRIRACTHQRPQRNKAQYAVSRRPIRLNGVRFVIHSRDERHTTQNNSICSPGEKDRKMYYGQLEEILKWSINGYAPPDIIDVDEDDDFIDDEDVLPCDLANSDDEVLANDDDVAMSADVTRGYGDDGGGDDRPPPRQIFTCCQCREAKNLTGEAGKVAD
ncbi:hypothetical protein Tco_0950790 [Tanacetum coccineum]